MFKINGRTFRVGVESMQRSVKKEYKYDVVTGDGTRRSEVRALYRVYTLALGNIRQEEYDALVAALTTYDETLVVELPDGQGDVTFEASCDDVSDVLEFVESDGSRWFGGLSITFAGTQPMEVG